MNGCPGNIESKAPLHWWGEVRRNLKGSLSQKADGVSKGKLRGLRGGDSGSIRKTNEASIEMSRGKSAEKKALPCSGKGRVESFGEDLGGG